MKIAWAIPIALMLILAWPAARHWLRHGPKGGADDWRAALLPLLGVAMFVMVLIWMVRAF